MIELAIGLALGYAVCSYLVGRHIDKKVEDAMTEHMLEVSWTFVNVQNGETYDVKAGFTYDTE